MTGDGRWGVKLAKVRKLVIDFKRRKAAIGGNFMGWSDRKGISRPWRLGWAGYEGLCRRYLDLLTIEMSLWFLPWCKYRITSRRDIFE